MNRTGIQAVCTIATLLFIAPAAWAAMPLTQSDDYKVRMNSPFAAAAPGVLANDSDADGDRLTAWVSYPPYNGTLTLKSNGSFIYTPNPGYSGPDSFVYTASDGAGGSATGFVNLSVISYVDGFSEDFNDGVADFWKPNRPRAWTAVGNSDVGIYILKPRSTPPAVEFSLFPESYADFIYSASVRLAVGAAVSRSRAMGLVFRSDGTYRNCYVFHINARGNFLIFKRVQGVTRKLMSGWTPSPAIVRGIGSWNVLEVEAFGPTMIFRINGTEVKRLTDGSRARGRAGLKAFGGRDGRESFEFDNAVLQVYLD